MEREIFVVVVLLVFGGVDHVETFTDKDMANGYIVEWANNNCTEDVSFETAEEALEWFSENDSLVDYTIHLHNNTLKMVDDYAVFVTNQGYHEKVFIRANEDEAKKLFQEVVSKEEATLEGTFEEVHENCVESNDGMVEVYLAKVDKFEETYGDVSCQ